jgi:hypothetical protein
MKLRLNFRLIRSLIVLLALPLVGCTLGQFRQETSGSSGGDAPSSTSGSAFRPSNDPRSDVRAALAKLNSAYPYRLTETAKATANGQTGPESTRVVEFAAADRSHMKWTGGPSGNIEAISIGDKHYWFSNGKWTEGPVPSMLGFKGEDFAKKLADMVKEVKYVGPETLNGMSCFAYTGTFETVMAGQKWSGTAKVWIGADDGLIHQSDSDFNAANYGGKSHTVYEYNVNIKVEPPAM